jgi:hypothetical protein
MVDSGTEPLTFKLKSLTLTLELFLLTGKMENLQGDSKEALNFHE